MYNLNVDLGAAAQGLLSIDSNTGSTTPRTPEILNSLIAMTNPLDNYPFQTQEATLQAASSSPPPHQHQNSTYLQHPHHQQQQPTQILPLQQQQQQQQNGKLSSKAILMNENLLNALSSSSSDSNSSSSQSEASPSLQQTIQNNTNHQQQQHTCSPVVRAGLKMTIEQKRKRSIHKIAENETVLSTNKLEDCVARLAAAEEGSTNTSGDGGGVGGGSLLDLDIHSSVTAAKRFRRNNNECSESEEDRYINGCSNGGGRIDEMQKWMWCENDEYSNLTAEDEERRRRRRERNKIAATKCRLKKREKTANLIQESEVLEKQNVELKTHIDELKSEKRTLTELLSLHRPHCQHNISAATKDSLYRLPSGATKTNFNAPSRPASVDASNFVRSSPAQIFGGQRASSASPLFEAQKPSTSANSQLSNYSKPPSIIVENVNDNHQAYHLQITNLHDTNSPPNDMNNDNYLYNSQCHNYQNYNTAALDRNGCMA